MLIQDQIGENIIGWIGGIALVRLTPEIEVFIEEKAKARTTEDVLNVFVNVNTQDLDEIYLFHKKYLYSPTDITGGYTDAFIREQSQVKSILARYSNNKLTRSDMKLIEEKIKDMNKKIRMVSGDDIEEVNEDLSKIPHREGLRLIHGSEYYFLEHVEYASLEIQIWHRLFSLIALRNKLRQCAEVTNCRRYFVPSKFSPAQKYCSDECKERGRN